MAKFQKINSMIDRMEARLDELEAMGVDITKLSTPESRRRQHEANRREAKQCAAAKVKGAADAKAAAATFAIGQTLRNPRGDQGVVVSISHTIVELEINGAARKFAPAMLRAI